MKEEIWLSRIFLFQGPENSQGFALEIFGALKCVPIVYEFPVLIS